MANYYNTYQYIGKGYNSSVTTSLVKQAYSSAYAVGTSPSPAWVNPNTPPGDLFVAANKKGVEYVPYLGAELAIGASSTAHAVTAASAVWKHHTLPGISLLDIDQVDVYMAKALANTVARTMLVICDISNPIDFASWQPTQGTTAAAAAQLPSASNANAINTIMLANGTTNGMYNGVWTHAEGSSKYRANINTTAITAATQYLTLSANSIPTAIANITGTKSSTITGKGIKIFVRSSFSSTSKYSCFLRVVIHTTKGKRILVTNNHAVVFTDNT